MKSNVNFNQPTPTSQPAIDKETLASDTEIILFDFNVSEADFSRKNNSLIIKLSGKSIELENFFALENLPKIELADGTMLSSEDFFAAYDPSIDISVAAGEEKGTTSSGLNMYNDTAASLIGGVEYSDRLDIDDAASLSSPFQENARLLASFAGADQEDAEQNNPEDTGSTGGDTDTSSGGDDTDSGSSGDDTDTGSGGDDTGSGSSGDDTDTGSGGDDTGSGSSGDDTDTGSGGDDTGSGSSGGDTDTGSGGDDTGSGSGGDDTGSGSSGGDTDTGPVTIYIAGDSVLRDGETSDGYLIYGMDRDKELVNDNDDRFFIRFSPKDAASNKSTTYIGENKDSLVDTFNYEKSGTYIGGNLYGPTETDKNIWNNDTISVTRSVVESTIYGGRGDDSVSLSNVYGETLIFGDDLSNTGNQAGNDTITITANVFGGVASKVSPDSAPNMPSPSTIPYGTIFSVSLAGNNFSGPTSLIGIEATGAPNTVYSASTFIGGDAYALKDGAGANDSIRIEGNVLGAVVTGDSRTMNNSTGGADAINIYSVGESSNTMDGDVYKVLYNQASLISGDAEEMSNNSKGGADSIQIQSLFATVAGDAYKMDRSAGGNDTITIANSQFGYVVGDAVIITNSTGGDDLISISTSTYSVLMGDGLNMLNSTGGKDSISVINAENSLIFGDAKDMSDSVGGDDSIHVTSLGSFTEVYGDAQNMANSTGGSDLIRISSTSSQATSSMIVGDAKSLINSKGGNDTIVAEDNSATILGDAYEMIGSTGGNDSISSKNQVTSFVAGDAYSMGNSTGGSDTITIETLGNAPVFGDASTMVSSRGGNDSITITTQLSFSDPLSVMGDAKQMDTSFGGNDTIRISQLNSGHVSGDGYSMNSSTGGNDVLFVAQNLNGHIVGDAYQMVSSRGGSDSITIETEQSLGSASHHPGTYGDAVDMENSIGGVDTITIRNSLTGIVAGDAYSMNNSRGGGDFIIAQSSVVGGAIYGDAYKMTGSELVGGNDIIRVNRDFSSGSTVSGDAHELEAGSGGDDFIYIYNSNGSIYGDAFTMGDAAQGGNDLIRINYLGGGFIYGDAKEFGATTNFGNDTIVIGNLYGTDSALVRGDSDLDNSSSHQGTKGDNTFIYEFKNTSGQAINAQNIIELTAGKVTIYQNGTNLTATTHTTIDQFNAIGGGDTADELRVHSIYSGDTVGMIGGGGADTFTLMKGFSGKAHIKDFSFFENDHLNLNEWLDGRSLGSSIKASVVSDGISIVQNNGTDLALLNISGSISYELEGQRHNFNNYADFYQGYIDLNEQQQQIIIEQLVKNIYG